MTGIPIIPVSDDDMVTVHNRIAFQFNLWNASIVEIRPTWRMHWRICGPPPERHFYERSMDAIMANK